MSRSLDGKVGFWTKIQLWMHLSMCGLCAQFRRTMIRVDQEVKQHACHVEQSSGNPEENLSAEARERITRKLQSRES